MDPSAIKNLDDLSRDFYRWEVKGEAEIADYVNNELMERDYGGRYTTGAAFYQLTKPERVQPHKQIMIYDRKTKKLYGGVQARSLIGAQANDTIRCKVDNFAVYDVFIKST